MQASTITLDSPTTVGLPDAAEPLRLYQCSTCQRSFSRADHLTRHVRAHTRQKPYVCPVCSKAFARIDLLKRHVTNHDSSNKRQKREITREARVIQACEACSQSHLRCEDDKPCTRCRKKNISCQVTGANSDDFNELDAVYAARDLLDLSHGVEYPASVTMENEAFDQIPPPSVRMGTSVRANRSTSSAAASADAGYPIEPVSTGRQAVPNIMPPPSPPRDDGLSYLQSLEHTPGIDMFLPDYFRNLPAFDSYVSGQVTPRGIMGLSFNLDEGFTDLDLGLLDQYNFQAPFAAETPSSDAQDPPEQPPQTDGVPIRTEAFKRSVWRYLPQRNRNPGAAEQSNLAFCHTEDGKRHPGVPQHRAVAEKLDRVSRDRLMAFILGTCSPSNVKQIASAFPSLELLDGLIQYFFTSPSINAQSFFHLPTFSPSKVSPELLACIAAAGAASTPDTPLRKLGFALHEISRAGQGREFESDNSAIRMLEHLQPLCLQLEIGMWSGVSRKMEIAESFTQPLVTMLRRGGRFRRAIWKEIRVEANDEGAVLESKWREWIHEESYLRLTYRVFELDRQSSLALLKPPLLSYSELELPLPSADDLWHAKTASEWKILSLAKVQNTSRRPSAIDCFLDLSRLTLHTYASSTYLHMVWGLVWEYRQVSTLTAKSQLKASNSLIVSSRYQELVKQLEDFQVSNSPLSKSQEILMELLLLHLNAPLDDMQLFAGIEGPEEARRAYCILREWIATDQSRKALCHAGRILRAAANLPKGLLCNFNAIAVYHAGLILWGYGFLWRNSSLGQDAGKSAQPLVVLNGPDSLAARRFIALDCGVPAIFSPGSQRTTNLSDVAGVMQGLVRLLQKSHTETEGSVSPLVGNLIQLLEGLGSASR